MKFSTTTKQERGHSVYSLNLRDELHQYQTTWEKQVQALSLEKGYES